MQVNEVEKIIHQEIVNVEVSFRKPKQQIKIDEKMLFGETKIEDEGLKDFISSYLVGNKVNWFGKNNKQLKRANAISQAVHRKKNELALDGKSAIPKDSLPVLKEFLKKKEEEFYEVREELYREHSHILDDFRTKLESDFIRKTNDFASYVDIEKMTAKVLSQVPTAEEMYNSFAVHRDYTLFAMSTEMIDEDDKVAVEQSTIRRMEHINGHTLSIIFDKANTVMKAMLERKLSKKHEKILLSIVQELENRNIFKNTGFDNLLEKAKTFAVETVFNLDVTEEMEYFLADVYLQADELNQLSQIDFSTSVLARNQLEFLSGELKQEKQMEAL